MKEALSDWLGAYGKKAKFNQTHLIVSWERLMGKTIAKRTERIFFKDKKIFIKLTSAPLKHELNLAKSKVLELLQKEYGTELFNEVVFL